jgi:hypothetical protein
MSARQAAIPFLPALPDEMVSAARDYLTHLYAIGVAEFLWESMEQPLADLDAITAVIEASGQAQPGAREQPSAMQMGAAIVVLGAARLDMDRMEARLLQAARDCGMGWAQIAAILGLPGGELERRYRQLTARLEKAAADADPQPPVSRSKIGYGR